MSVKAQFCRGGGCAGKPYLRGVCKSCYDYYWRDVKIGRATWNDLEASGRCLPIKGVKRGSHHPNWKGGRVASRRGYVHLVMPNHHRADSSGRVAEHIVVAERALGHRLPPGAVVHHHNQNKHDNRPQNLVICESTAYHALLHCRMRQIALGADPNKEKVCNRCKRALPFSAFWKGNTRREYMNLYNGCKACLGGRIR